MRKSLFVTVLLTISCGLLWILFLAASHRGPVFDAGTMVHLKGGVWSDPQQPDCKVEVGPFWIDKYEVTNAQYARFRPEHTYPEQQDDFPVTNITWEEAAAYAQWIGKQLPTEAEWELAAGAPDGRLYPWGQEKRLPEITELQKVGSYRENVSPAGCYDMEGSVWEWTSDDGATPDASTAPAKILKGGWNQVQKTVVPATLQDRKNLAPQTRLAQVGFRCVKRL